MKNVPHYYDGPDILLRIRGARKWARCVYVCVPVTVCITGVYLGGAEREHSAGAIVQVQPWVLRHCWLSWVKSVNLEQCPPSGKSLSNVKSSLAGVPYLSWLDFRTESATIFLSSFISPQKLYMVSFLVKPKWLQIIPQSWGVRIGFWWMKLSCKALITLEVADATSEVGGTCERRWGLDIYDALWRKMTARQGKGQRMGVVRKEWEGASLGEGKTPYLTRRKGLK